MCFISSLWKIRFTVLNGREQRVNSLNLSTGMLGCVHSLKRTHIHTRGGRALHTLSGERAECTLHAGAPTHRLDKYLQIKRRSDPMRRLPGLCNRTASQGTNLCCIYNVISIRQYEKLNFLCFGNCMHYVHMFS